MKNKILYLIISVLAVGGLSGCHDITTEGFTEITYYPTLEVLGEPVLIIEKGSNYVDAGAVAILNGEDVTDQIVIKSNVNASEGGVYSVSYEISNEDGFKVSGSRTVYVADPTPSIISSGLHKVTTGSHRLWQADGAIVNFSGYEILILQTEPGIFYISDYMGGYYDQRVGYGSKYAMYGYFRLNPDNTITPLSSHVDGWGDSMDQMNSSAVDPGTGKISYSIDYAGLMTFNIFID